MRIVGVPEMFNLPFKLMLADNPKAFNWQEVSQGTGEMCRMLREDEADLAIMLTEGTLKDIVAGAKHAILEIFVSSPLIWGIHSPFHSELKNAATLAGKTAAISRFGSGSHLMCKVLAEREKFDIESINYKIVGNADGAVKAFENNLADFFLWEKFTTQPYVNAGKFNRIGELPSPWPSFVIVASKFANAKFTSEIKALIEQLKEKASYCKNNPEAIAEFTAYYDIPHDEVKAWLSQTVWFGEKWSEDTLLKITQQLKHFQII